MNFGDSVHDASRSGLDEASQPGTSASSNSPSRSPRTQKPIQDIQDIIDKLAAVTQQLRQPGTGRGRATALACEAQQQAEALRLAERGGAQERERADVAGDVRRTLQVDTAG